MPAFKIIDGSIVSSRRQEIIEQWNAATPFPLVIIDNFADASRLQRLADQYPDPESLKKSRDFIFAKNKFEKNQFAALSHEMSDLYDDIVSPAFQRFLSELYGRNVFVDPDFHGGGLHMGGAGSFLDMHADFNVHPLHQDWLRELNVLLYLNVGWQPAWGGQLKLRHKHTGQSREIEPLFNRCVIMLTKDFTLHGYDQLHFPQGRYRKSVATYAYSHISSEEKIVPRTTMWASEKSWLRRQIGPLVPAAVRIKNRLFGSGSTRNR